MPEEYCGASPVECASAHDEASTMIHARAALLFAALLVAGASLGEESEQPIVGKRQAKLDGELEHD